MAIKKTTQTVKEDVKPVAKAEVKAEVKPAAKAEVKVEAKPEVKEEVKAEAKPAAKKAAAKKETAKKETVKKEATKKETTKKAAAVATVSVQFDGKSYTTEDLVKIAQDVWKYDLEKKEADFKNVELYVKPEESMVYYVINGDVTGSFAI